MSDRERKVVEPRKKNTAEKREPKKLETDYILKSEKGAEYLVGHVLGKGGFGEVWQVCLLKEQQKKFAMKTESNFAEPGKKSYLRLKMEVNLFEEIQKASSKVDKNHFVKMHDKGKTVDFKYYVMDLIWMSLKDAKKFCGGEFRPHTNIQIARQTLKGIESLHELGFLHRDIKPANFAVGLPPKDNIIYTLDFGIARSFRDKDGGVRNARKTVQFMGTPMFASTEAHCMKEQARRDDLECWLYMMLDNYNANNLPWCCLEKDEVNRHVELRLELLASPRDLHAAGKLIVPEKWCDIIDLLNGMAFDEPGDFVGINLILSQICVDENVDENLPLDWFGKKPKSPEKPKREERKPSEKRQREARRKKTAEKPEPAADKPDVKKRPRKEGEESGSGGEESEEEDSYDYEAYLRWRKRRKNRKKPAKNKPKDNSDRDKPRKPRKKGSKDRRGSEVDKDVKEVKPPEYKNLPEVKREDDKKVAAPEKKPEPVVEDKDKKRPPAPPTPEQTSPVKVEAKVDKIVEVAKKKNKTPDEEKEREKDVKKAPAVNKSNESNQEREEKKDEKKVEKKKRKKKGNKTPDGSCQSMDDYPDAIPKIDDQKKKLPALRKKETNKLKADAKKPPEKPLLKAPLIPDPKKAQEVAPARK